MRILKLFFFCSFLALASGCKQEPVKVAPPPPPVEKVPERLPTDYSAPKWAKNANLYEVNLRQYTKEGTFNAFVEHLPRLKKMGIDILWFMPIYPISKVKRKGTLGSYYAVADYKAVNPEFGTMEDFDNMVKAIHDQGMHLILDWVPNHTGWDHPWITEHPEWYTQDKDGNIIDPIDPGTGKSWGWTDVADLNYDNKEMRAEMISDMSFWITEKKIDGYRMDVAHNVPDDFWQEVRDALFAHRRAIFMLAESEVPTHRNNRYFHATYGWSMHHLLNEIAQGKKKASDIDTLLKKDRRDFKKGYHIHFTSNHDENTWNGTVMERMGDAHKALAAFSATFAGMHLIYGGQEEPLRKRLEFFEKDDIGFQNYEYEEFYTTLNKLKRESPAMMNGRHGGKPEKMLIDNDDAYFFIRTKNGHKVMGLFNLSDKQNSIAIPVGLRGTDIFTGRRLTWMGDDEVLLKPWQFYILKNK